MENQSRTLLSFTAHVDKHTRLGFDESSSDLEDHRCACWLTHVLITCSVFAYAWDLIKMVPGKASAGFLSYSRCSTCETSMPTRKMSFHHKSIHIHIFITRQSIWLFLCFIFNHVSKIPTKSNKSMNPKRRSHVVIGFRIFDPLNNSLCSSVLVILWTISCFLRCTPCFDLEGICLWFY